MHGLKVAVRAFCVIAFVTGALDIVNGIGLLGSAGARLDCVANDPMLNSQVRFWGAIWFGFGLILWRTSAHLDTEAGLFRLLCGIIGLCGLARLASAILYGLPGTVLTGAMVIELGCAVLFYVWHGSVARRTTAGLVT